MIANVSDVIESELKKYERHGSKYFSFYALLKLDFSLLTAPDYYTTNDFMGDTLISNFGLMDSDFKELLFRNFIDNKKASHNGG